MIRINNLSREYKVFEKESGFLLRKKKRSIHALNNLSLTVMDGTNIGILGMNGAGKSTFIKLMCGIIAPTAGEILVDNYIPFHKDKEYLKKITLVSGNKTQLNYDLSARDNFLFLGTIYGVSKKEIKQKVNFLAEELGCPDLVDRQVRKLSFGERLKMEIIASLLHEPQYIFLDEPTIGLDVKTQNQLRKFIKNYNDGSKIIFIASHNLEDISEVCENILFIDHGNLSYYGELIEFCKSYSMSRQVRVEVMPENWSHILTYLECKEQIIKVRVEDNAILFEVLQDNLVENMKELLGLFSYCILSFDMDDSGMVEILKKKILEG